MIRRATRILNWTTIPSILVIIGWLFGTILPGSYWMRASVSVPTQEPGDVRLYVERQIHRQFFGQYYVRVWRESAVGWFVVCDGHGGGQYRSGAELPPHVTLSWWTSGRCAHLNPGTYKITTEWLIPHAFGTAIVESTSNIFTVRDRL